MTVSTFCEALIPGNEPGKERGKHFRRNSRPLPGWVGAATASSRTRMPSRAAAPPKERVVPHMLGGVAARTAAETFSSPFNLLKVRQQFDASLMRRPLLQAVAAVIQKEGIFGAWRGLPPRLVWSTPVAAASFGYYHQTKIALQGSTDRDADTSRSSSSMRTVFAGPLILAATVLTRMNLAVAQVSAHVYASPNPVHQRCFE